MPKKPEEFDEIDIVAEQMFDYACSVRGDNLNKDGSAGNPRKIAGEYKDLWEPSIRFYRSFAEWHLKHMYNSKVELPVELSITPDLGKKRDYPQVM